MTNRTQRIIDVALQLRDSADGAETSSANETAIAFDCRHIGEYKAVVFIQSIDGADGNETYTFDISVSDVIAGTFTKIAQTPAIAGNGVSAPLALEIPLSGKLADQFDNDAAFIRVGCTLAGTTPSINYDAYLTKV